MKKKTKRKPGIKICKKTLRGRPRKIAKPIDKTKLKFQEIRKEFKRLKKSKRRMQLLWYRTKKEHVALMKDLDKRIKKLKDEIIKSKSTRKHKPIKRIVKKSVAKIQKAHKPMAKKSEAKNYTLSSPK
jgi:sugar-specific transcriptional regulator TrmB